ncbi:MAG TPA: hypothetical protein VGN63_05235 [Flavisolibacter sp.]|jgi:hypothetical protein|nr:hypothetical protein [Flavisolibacter sp.]
MKPVSAWLIAAAIFITATNANAQTSPVVQTSNTNEQQPYKLALTNLSFGNNQYTKYVLNTWKAYDNNMLDDIAFIVSDTIRAGLADGRMIRGKEAFMSGLKEYRGGFASVSSKVITCTTLKSPDEPEQEFTLIWGEELDTKKDGTMQKFSLHEIFIFNKSGKLAEFYQYAVPLPLN